MGEYSTINIVLLFVPWNITLIKTFHEKNTFNTFKVFNFCVPDLSRQDNYPKLVNNYLCQFSRAMSRPKSACYCKQVTGLHIALFAKLYWVQKSTFCRKATIPSIYSLAYVCNCSSNVGDYQLWKSAQCPIYNVLCTM